ncbi:MAG: AMP-binding protein, partial [Deltaproteobacteria bacterium]|nr:AMP-binding protein [Deltaproteobacteria bacterium]
MHELSLLAAAIEDPGRDCLIAGGRVWSYADVSARVRTAMASLCDRGVERGDRVALTPEVDVDSMVWLYALFELGCPAVLLHSGLRDRERAVILEEAQPAHRIDGRVTDETSAPPISRPASVPVEQTLVVAYTSGSSGTPRGASLSRRAFIASEAAHASNLGWLPDDRWLLCMPPAHVGGLSIVTRSLIARRCIVLGPGPFDPRALSRRMADDRVTLLSVVPTMLRRLLLLDDPVWTPRPELRAVLVGGAPFPLALREKAKERGAPALGTYGCTEACSQVTTQTPEQSRGPGSGGVLPGAEVRIENDEIQIRGDVLMDGYLGEDRSGEPWTPDGWFRTGDFGSFLPDGQLRVGGRLDDLIITGGENVAPREVEAWLETVPGIESAYVFSLPHADWGEEVVAALVVDSARYSAQRLGAQLEKGLAPYKHPRRFCVLDALPLNRSGKVDQVAVKALCGG